MGYLKIDNLVLIAVVVAGAFLTNILSVNLSLGAVIAAGVTGLASAVALRKYSAAAYCGAFVGMVSCELSQGHLFLLLASLIAGLLYVISLQVFIGFGGKLGTIAFAGCLTVSVLLGRDFLSEPVIWSEASLLIILYSVIAAVLTYIIHIRLGKDPVLASSIVGIIAGISLPVIHSQTGETLAVIAICASFAGMSSKKRIPNESLIVLTGVFTAVAFILSAPHLGGAGGKLGTLAFGSVLAVSGLYSIFPKITGR